MLNLSEREKAMFPVAVVLLALAAVLRTQPHLSNSTPFFAVAILIGFVMGPQRALLAGVLSALAMLAGDFVIGMHWTMIFVYAGIAMASLLGSLGSTLVLNRRSWFGRILSAFLMCGLASTVFFIISNFGVWLVGVDSGLAMYPMTFAGLVECFTLAIPFFTRSLTADLVYGTVFVAIAARLMVTQSKTAQAAAMESNGR